jgi:hypothetical protein
MVLPARVVNARFYRIHLLIVLGLTAAAAVAAGDIDHWLWWICLGLAGGACIAGSLSWSAEADLAGYAALGIAACTLISSSLLLGVRVGASSGSVLFALADDLTAAALLGMAVTAMLLGHWYLIAPNLTIQPLLRLIAALFLTIGCRAMIAAIWLVPQLFNVGSFDSTSWLWLAVRWLAGFGGLLVLTWMAWQAARIRSTQSATGTLYVVVIFAFFGELTDQLLHGHLSTTPTEILS